MLSTLQKHSQFIQKKHQNLIFKYNKKVPKRIHKKDNKKNTIEKISYLLEYIFVVLVLSKPIMLSDSEAVERLKKKLL